LIQVYDQNDNVALANINTRFLSYGLPLNAIEYQGSSIVAAHFTRPTPAAPIPTSRLVKYSGAGYATSTVLAGPIPFTQLTGLASEGSHCWVADVIAGTIYEFGDNGLGAPVATGLVNPPV